MNEHIKILIAIQTEINRAVWAANQNQDKRLSEGQLPSEYIEDRIRIIKEDLKKLGQGDLFDEVSTQNEPEEKPEELYEECC